MGEAICISSGVKSLKLDVWLESREGRKFGPLRAIISVVLGTYAIIQYVNTC